jgi:hypothetical protein
MDKEFSKLCTPAKIYFVIAVIAIVLALFSGMGVVYAFVKLVFAFIWTFILSWLCDKGFKALSWFLVLLPYVVILLALLGLSNSSMMSYSMMMYPGYSAGYGSKMYGYNMMQPMYGYNMMQPMNGAGMKMPMMGSGMMMEGMKPMKK